MDLLLIRHALPVRVEDVAGGADPELAPEGHEQSKALAAWLADEHIDALYTSPMRRAIETAAPIVDRLGLAPTVVDGLAEFDRSKDHYIPLEELKESGDPRYEELLAGDYFADSGTTADEFRATVLDAVDGVIADNPGKVVAAVCHGGVINAYLSVILGIEEVLFFQPAYTGITRIKASSRGHRSIQSVNETGHLRG